MSASHGILRLMPHATTDDVHRRFDERKFEEELVVGNRFQVPHFLERFDEQDRHGEAQEGRDEKDHREVRRKLHLEFSDDDLRCEDGTEPPSDHGSDERAGRDDTIAHGDGTGPFLALHKIIDDVLKSEVEALTRACLPSR